MSMRIPSVRDAVQPSNGSDGEMLPPPPLSFRLLRTHFPYSLYIEQLPKALRGPSAPLAEPLPPSPWTRGGRRPWRWGVDLRTGGQRQGTGRDSRILSASRARSGRTGWPFRRDGITVPAQRHRGSGATASPFRRNGIVRKESTSGRQGRQSSAVRTIMDRGDRKNQDLNPTLRT